MKKYARPLNHKINPSFLKPRRISLLILVKMRETEPETSQVNQLE